MWGVFVCGCVCKSVCEGVYGGCGYVYVVVFVCVCMYVYVRVSVCVRKGRNTKTKTEKSKKLKGVYLKDGTEDSHNPSTLRDSSTSLDFCISGLTL